MSEENYFKDVKKSIFYRDWIPFSVVGTLACLGFFVVFLMVLHILFFRNFALGDRLSQILRSNYIIMISFISLFLFSLDARKAYRLVKEKPFASVSNDRLILNFGRDSFQWESIQSVDMEGERKLTVKYNDKGKSKKKVNDLKWLSKKEDFIYNLKNNCSTRNIPYREADMTHSSQIAFYLIIMKRFLFDPELKG